MKGGEISCRSSRVDRRLSPLGTQPHPLHRLLAHDDDDDDEHDEHDGHDECVSLRYMFIMFIMFINNN